MPLERTQRGVTVAVLLGLLAGCQTPGAAFSGFTPVPAGMSQLYVYRPASAVETTPSVVFQLDGRDLAHVRNGGYATLTIAPGAHALTAGPDGLAAASPKLEKRIELAAGQSLVCGYRSEGTPGAMIWQLACVDANQAPPDLAGCNLEPLSPGWPTSP
jgi:hypothetical protein